MRPFISLSFFIVILPFVLSCEYGEKNDNHNYHGEIRFTPSPNSNEDCYIATLVNKYHNHDYFFDASICKNQTGTFHISTPHGKKDRYFKINYNDSKGKQISSLTSKADNPEGCTFEKLQDKSKVDHITVQEWKLTSTGACWFNTFFCSVTPPPWH
jgi:hypothetical protein